MTGNEVLWYVSRATGLASIVLLTVVLVLGVLGPIRRANRRPTKGIPPAVAVGLHRTLALGMVCFLAVHIVTAVVETYVNIGWISVLVPFTSGYEPVFVGLGTIAIDLLIAVVATALLRKSLAPGVWRVVHRAAYALWPIAALHGLLLGSGEPALLRYVTIACIGAGLFAIALRAASRGPTPAATRDRGAARPDRAGARPRPAQSSRAA